MQARLKVLHDKANVKQVKLLPVTLIGRSTDCNLKIASSQVSRNHCRITLGVDSVFVEDLGSANGTLVDGQPLPAHQPTAIAPGAHLIVGPAEFQIDYVASTSVTMVLPRTGVVPQPDLPSTEMIFPAPVAAPVPVKAPSAETIATAPAPALPNAMAVAPAVVAASVVAQELASVHEMEPAHAEGDTQFLESPFNSDALADPEASEATQFMFQATVPEAAPAASVAPATTAAPEAAPRKAGLKSLFSLFGRKDKAGADESAAAVVAATAPSVFLPTVEAQAPAEEALEAQVATVPEETPAEASEFAGDDSTQTVSEGDDNFQQFLSQF